MQLRELQFGELTILEVCGDEARTFHNPLTEKLEELFAGGTRNILIDFSGLDRLSEDAARGLLCSYARLTHEGGRVRLMQNPRLVQGLDTWELLCEIIGHFPDKEEAMQSFAQLES